MNQLPSLTSHFLSGLDDLLWARIGLGAAGGLLCLISGRRLARYRRGGASQSLDCLGGGMTILSKGSLNTKMMETILNYWTM